MHQLEGVARGSNPGRHDVAPVLIGPEIRDRGEGLQWLAVTLEQQIAGGRHPLLDRVGPVLDPHRPLRRRVGERTKQPIRPARDIAGREHTGRRAAVLIADHSVADGQPRIGEPFNVGAHTDPDDDGIGLDLLAASELHCLDPRVSEQRRDGLVATQCDPGGTMQPSRPVRELHAQQPDHGAVERFDHSDVESARTARTKRLRRR